MSHPVAIVFIDPWNSVFLAVSTVLLLVSLRNLWRHKKAAALMAVMEDQLADLFDRGGLPAKAAVRRESARQWRRLAWQRRVPAAPKRGAS